MSNTLVTESKVPKSIQAYLKNQKKMDSQFESYHLASNQIHIHGEPKSVNNIKSIQKAFELRSKLSKLYGKMEVIGRAHGESVVIEGNPLSNISDLAPDNAKIELPISIMRHLVEYGEPDEFFHIACEPKESIKDSLFYGIRVDGIDFNDESEKWVVQCSVHYQADFEVPEWADSEYVLVMTQVLPHEAYPENDREFSMLNSIQYEVEVTNPADTADGIAKGGWEKVEDVYKRVLDARSDLGYLMREAILGQEESEEEEEASASPDSSR